MSQRYFEPVDPEASPRTLYTVPETARYLRCGRSTVYKLISEGKLQTVRITDDLQRIPLWSILELQEPEYGLVPVTRVKCGRAKPVHQDRDVSRQPQPAPSSHYKGNTEINEGDLK